MKRFLAVSLLTACGVANGEIGELPKTQPYAVSTTVDLSVEAILPADAELVVAALREFSMNPAETLIALASDASVPELNDLYAVLPSQLKSQFEGWFNDEIAKVTIDGMKVTDWAGMIAGLSDAALSKFNIDSSLELDGSTATHTWTGLDFSPSGLDVLIPIGGKAADVLTQHPSLIIAEGGAITLGDQQFGLQFGEYAWNAINAVCEAQSGEDIRGTLGTAINCPNLAHNIANKCILTVCVGHENDISEVCENGLDLLVDKVHAAVGLISLNAFTYASGTAQLVDDHGDGSMDQISNGTWDAAMNLGAGLRHTPATFVGER